MEREREGRKEEERREGKRERGVATAARHLH